MKRPVGLYVLQKKGTIKTIRRPEKYIDCLDAEVLYKILRKQEYEQIILKKYGYLPEVSAFKYYIECKKLFVEIPLEESYTLVLKLLKKRAKIIKAEYEQIPYELKFLAYFMGLREDDYKKIMKFLIMDFFFLWLERINITIFILSYFIKIEIKKEKVLYTFLFYIKIIVKN